MNKEMRTLADKFVELELDNMRARSRHVQLHENKPWSSLGGGIHVSHELGRYLFLPNDVSTPLPDGRKHLEGSLNARHNNLQSSIQSCSDHQLLALHDFLDQEIENDASEDEPPMITGGYFEFVNNRKPEGQLQSIRNGFWLREKAQHVAQIRLSTFHASPYLASECFGVNLVHLDMAGKMISGRSTWSQWIGFDAFKHYLARINKVLQSQPPPPPPRKAVATFYQTWLRDLDTQKDTWAYKIVEHAFHTMKTQGQVEGKEVAMAKLWQIKLKKVLPDIQAMEESNLLENPTSEPTEWTLNMEDFIDDNGILDKLAVAAGCTASLQD
ncbi:hypothetical protein CTA2_1659 [Colletotrichum tanaceti]|uniref:Uncharacterized protein n=1 Tax=Colletotrichum tanaceti TaxID=1306861 RepID=A0A4U6X2Z5_9PEZI|nr:hypothetical protein CTA2_1659 [Colletotrichum tanaceti]TKW49748.1 hypothetical protein CTA1_3464 [Colletotrichum tanaceti]